MHLVRSYDTTAPGFEPDAAGLPWYRRAMRQGGGYTAPSSLFLFIPLVATFGRISPEAFAVVAAQCLVIAVFYLGASLAVALPHEWRWVWLMCLMLGVLSLAWSSETPGSASYYTAYVTVVAAMLLPWWEALRLIVFAALGGVILAGLGRDPYAALMAFIGGLIGFSVGLGIDRARSQAALKLEESRTAVLAVSAERERIGRDLHDILGHSLTTIAVKADLARRLIDRDPARAASELDDLAAVARTALADVRATASGMREVRLASELASARSVLGASGIECRTSSALPPLSDVDSELLGYALRESVTNVVRHSGATVCTIEASQTGVTVTDDGRGFRGGVRGNGLDGLARRLRASGGRLDVASGPSGTTVRALLAPRAGTNEGTTP